MTRFLSNRAILVVGALICLCLSDSAGPRLLPLPASTLIAVNPFTLDSNLWTSRAPDPSSELNTHIEMVSGSQYRTRDRHHHVQPALHAPQISLQLHPTNLGGASESYAPLKSNSAALLIPPGRAPPRFA